MKRKINLLKQDTGRHVFTHPINAKMTLDIQVHYQQREDSLKSSHVTVYLHTNTLTHGRTLINHEWSVKINGQVHKRVCMNGFTFGHDMSIDLDLDDFIDGNHRDKVTLLLNFEILTKGKVDTEFESLNQIMELGEMERYDQDLAATIYRILNKLIQPNDLLWPIEKSKTGILSRKEISDIKQLSWEKGCTQGLSQLLFYLSLKKCWFPKLVIILCEHPYIQLVLLLILLNDGDFNRGWEVRYFQSTGEENLAIYTRFQGLASSLVLVLSAVTIVIAVHGIYAISGPTQLIQTMSFKSATLSLPLSTRLMGTVVAHKTIEARRDVAGSNPNKDKTVANFIDGKNNVCETAINVNINGNSFVILKTGLYYVYMSVGLNWIKGNNSTETTCTTLFYYLYRVSAVSDMLTTVLARSLQVCSDVTQAERPSYTGGVFKLYSGDKIEVHLHGLHKFELIPQSSFVGLFMVRPEP